MGTSLLEIKHQHSGDIKKIITSSAKYIVSEAATETIFENICSFLPGTPFPVFFQEALCNHRTDVNFPGRFVCSPNRYKFSRRTWSVHRTDTIFLGALFMCSSNRYRFSRSTFLATEQIPIFQEQFFSYRTDNDFLGSLFRISTNR